MLAGSMEQTAVNREGEKKKEKERITLNIVKGER